jgi:micrococcal nuclease
MNRFPALLTALLVTFSAYLLVSLDKNQNLQSVIISRAIDGDTLETLDGKKLRLSNINSPEKNNPGYEESKDFSKSLEGKNLSIEILGADKYNRLLVRLYDQDKYINYLLVKEGLASKFLVEKSELKLFSDSEKNAINNNKGVWKYSKYSKCFSSKINPSEEYVLIQSHCGKINFSGWTIKDESRKLYHFPSLNYEKFTLYSSSGESNSTSLFWGQSSSVWNNDRDTLYLFDNQGGLAHHEEYGY